MTWYRTGTVAVVNGSQIVTGTGTAWASNAQPGLAFKGPDYLAYEIASVDSDTQLTLAEPYHGGSGSGGGYAIVPLSGYVQTTLQMVQQFLTTYGGYISGPLAGRFADGTVSTPGIAFTSDQDSGIYRIGGDAFGFAAGGVKRFEITGGAPAAFAETSAAAAMDLVGRSADNFVVMRLLNNARTVVTGQVAVDGSGNTQVASFGGSLIYTVASGTKVHAWVIGPGPVLQLSPTSLAPGNDNALALGGSSSRYSTVYAGTGTISTSDARTKTVRGALATAELAAAKAIAASIRVFQFNDAIADKGLDGARLHVGVIAQTVISIMQDHGLEPMRYAFVCHDEWTALPAQTGSPAIPGRAAIVDDDGKIIAAADPGRPALPGLPGRQAGDLYSIRYDELAMFIGAAQEQRLLALEAA